MPGKLAGKIALVTGGSAGIGRAAARSLVAAGAHVFITGRRQDELDAAVDHIRDHVADGHASEGQVRGGQVTAVRGAGGALADLDQLFAAIAAEAGHLDIIVANAGTYEVQPLAEVTEASFDKMFSLNVRGLLFTIQKALPILRDGASIVLLGSIGGSKGFAGFTVYDATKAAVRSFARTWTAELKDRKIRVNVVSPGPVGTPGFDLVATDELRQALIGLVPLGRIATAEEIAKAILFLASDDSSFITGTELFVDGGLAQI